ncbi:hypothetical protein BV22DRAFT_1044674 [Leucogyrophana mollusca]|uniref:Uncharacterized protein n=1 Tax=Leucogyrophana mollusca TaxID=85980 RepID=A0ACB8BV00_9AGAM|nr:hypothetical protein BV22DRAFT_1044674 [Leucogyrophana mollusca]
MPLDGHSYLTSYGWSGKGTGLRKGAIDKPLAIPQKKNLAGLGKDRDEAFPFWDHLFTAASKSITIKVTTDDEDEDGNDSSAPLTFTRTATGIISNRRPITGTPASGVTTPDSDTTLRLSLISAAKREAAKKGLYSRFFRGPILGPDDDASTTTVVNVTVVEEVVQIARQTPEETKVERRERKRLKAEAKEAKKNAKAKKRKCEELLETEEERSQRKRLKKEMKKAKKLALAGLTDKDERKIPKKNSMETEEAKKVEDSCDRPSSGKPPAPIAEGGKQGGRKRRNETTAKSEGCRGEALKKERKGKRKRDTLVVPS